MSMDQEIRNRFTVLFWAVGIVAAVQIAMLGNLIAMSYQLGQINGSLSVLINHAQFK